jgi:hypothetical protein
MSETQTMTIEDSFGRLKFEYDRKLAEIKALAAQQKASAQRLDDFLKREAAAKTALQQVSAALDQANKELAQARGDASKVKSEAAAEREAILAGAHIEADGFLRGVTSAVAAAASLVKRPADAVAKKKSARSKESSDNGKDIS